MIGFEAILECYAQTYESLSPILTTAGEIVPGFLPWTTRDKKWIFTGKQDPIFFFPVWLRNRLISARLKPVLSHTEKLCMASYYRQYSTSIKIKIIQLKKVFLGLALSHAGLRKLVLIL